MPRQPRMLIVEDELDVSGCLEDFFKGRGFLVDQAFSGEAALEQVERMGPPDAILLDILLPGVSGLEVLKRIKARHPTTCIVIVTGLDRLDLRTEAKLYGAAAYVTKPFDFSDDTWSSVLGQPV